MQSLVGQSLMFEAQHQLSLSASTPEPTCCLARSSGGTCHRKCSIHPRRTQLARLSALFLSAEAVALLPVAEAAIQRP